jgi:hypothetical protein
MYVYIYTYIYIHIYIYKGALSRAFAAFFHDCLQRHRHRISGDAEQADHVMSEFIWHSSMINGGTMMPDYQPV